ncbi:hypothetical protein VIN01S_03880 [Vibrio inusitatus NBRC 102082]|uniref:Fimbrial protein n=1 Tax=Vibrio inusitatus NBRC 102082 TaxID=1219070 RepID=A0A4Y3HTF3_9VIBR|nr:Flp family type IVb pilin [Vibrio inusitatus]GEA49584.1 hypothetical protein VIN01S_03880 [Vibrio inusitatus NBRC 102082]
MFKTFLTRFIKDERGVTAIEYGVIGVALATVLGVVMYTGVGGGDGLVDAIGAAFTDIVTAMGGVDPSGA